MKEVSYQEARYNIEDGDIIFVCNAKTLTSKMIRFFTRSKYSHVGIAFWATVGGVDRLFIAEAQGGTKRRIITMSFYAKDELHVIKSPRAWNEYSDVALQDIGIQEYGWIQAAYVGFREALLNYFNIKLTPKDFDGEICSEYVANMLNILPPNVSPEGLYQELLKNGYDISLVIKKALTKERALLKPTQFKLIK